MKLKNVLLSSLLVGALALTACSGGGQNKTDAEKKDNQTAQNETKTDSKETTDAIKAKISVQVESAWKEFYQKAVERVKEKNPEAEIELIETGSFDHLDVIDSTDATNEDVADLFALPADRLYSLKEKEVLAAVDSQKLQAALGGFSDFDNGMGGNFKVDGQYLAFPYNIETLITFVNTKNAETKGIDYSKSMEINDAKDASTILIPAFDAWYGVAVTNSSAIELLGKDESGKLFSDLTKNYTDLEADKKATIKSLYEYWKKNLDESTPLFDAEAGWGYIDEQFKTGNGGVARIGGPWETAAITELAGVENLEIYPISQITVASKPLSHWKGGWGLAINSRIEEDKDKMALAEAMILEIVNPEYAVDLFKATGKILENVSPEVYDNSDLSDVDKKVVKAVIESYQSAPARPLFSEWGNVWDSWKNAVLSWNSVKPADDSKAYDELKASFEAMMANFN